MMRTGIVSSLEVAASRSGAHFFLSEAKSQ